MRGTLLFISTLALVAVLVLSDTTLAQLSVGVKKGDWIEYNVTYTGSPTAGHDINWARMEITDVQGTNISVNIISRFPNGTTENTLSILNLKTGHLIDDFIIPADLKPGETFLDENLGNVTIAKAEQHQYAGATRTVLYANTSTNTYVWDQSTGVSVEGTAQTADYSIHTLVADTNMWQPSSGQNLTLLLIVGIALVIAASAIAGFYYRRKKRKLQKI